MIVTKWLNKNTTSLSGKRIAISGATGGIGRELCRYLCMLGADLILLDRNPEKSKALQTKLKNEFPNSFIEGLIIDLENMEDVKRVATALSEKPLHALILNAGAYCIPRHACSTGVDNIFSNQFFGTLCSCKVASTTFGIKWRSSGCGRKYCSHILRNRSSRYRFCDPETA